MLTKIYWLQHPALLFLRYTLQQTITTHLDNIYKREATIKEAQNNHLTEQNRNTTTMVVTSLHSQIFSSTKQISPSLLLLHNTQTKPTKQNSQKQQQSSHHHVLSVKSYMENQNSFSSFANKVIGSLPVIGLVARIVSDEGGVGSDLIDFAEFRRRVGKKCGINDTRAFYEFQERHGKAGDPLYVLLCCWLTAVGAGLLKSEEILEGASRLRLSNDLEFEEQNFMASMNEARERRAKLNAATPSIPMEIRAEKALEAIYICSFGKKLIEEDDERLLNTILCAVFPSVKREDIMRIVKEKANRVAEGEDENSFPEPKPLPKEAVEMQMKDLQFLRQQNRDT